LSPGKRNAALILINTALFFAGYNAMVAVFPLYVVYRGGGEGVVGLLVGLFSLSAVVLRFFLTKAAERRGQKWLLAAAVLSAGTAPLLYLLDLGLWYLAAVRIYHAVSLAAFITASQTVLAASAPPEKRGRLFGLYGVVTGLAMAGAPSLGQWVSAKWGYAAFFVGTGLLGLAMVPGQVLLKEPQGAAGQGQAAVPWREVLANRWVVSASLGVAAAAAALGGLSSFLPLYTQKLGLTQFGIYFAAFSLAYTLGGYGAGVLSDRFGRRAVVLWSLPLLSLGLVGLVRLGGYLPLAGCGLCIGFGFGAASTALLVLVTDKTKERERAQAVTFYNNCIDLGVSGGAMLLGGVAALSYNLLWILLSLITAAGFALVLLGMPREGAAPAPAEGKWRK